MKSLRNWLTTVSIVIVLVFMGLGYILYYPYIHQRTVVGPVNGVHQLFENVAYLAGSKSVSPQIYSAAVAVKDIKNNEIVTGSTEDRQWGVVKEGQCVQAVFFPYPPWNLQKSSTYHNVRVEKVYENCDSIANK